MPYGYPNALLEIRQDLIDTKQGAARWAGTIAEALSPILEEPALNRPMHAPETEAG